MDIDEDGRWFVVEMPGYPLDTSPSGRIKLLEDTNGDGRPDKATVFADGLVLPTGVMRWKRGVLVTAAPDVLYFEDTDGDGKADERTVVLTGFAVTNPQHSVNARSTALDNWIQLAYSGGGGALIYPGAVRRPRQAADVSRLARRSGRRRQGRARAASASIRHASSRARATRSTATPSTRGATTSRREQRPHPPRGRRRAVPGAEPAAAAAAARCTTISDHGGAARVFPITRQPAVRAADRVGRVHVGVQPHARTPAGCSTASTRAARSSPSRCTTSCTATSIEPSGATFVARRGAERRASSWRPPTPGSGR